MVDIPNKETLEAIKEVQQMKKNPALGKAYTDVDEMMKELLDDKSKINPGVPKK